MRWDRAVLPWLMLKLESYSSIAMTSEVWRCVQGFFLRCVQGCFTRNCLKLTGETWTKHLQSLSVHFHSLSGYRMCYHHFQPIILTFGIYISWWFEVVQWFQTSWWITATSGGIATVDGLDWGQWSGVTTIATISQNRRLPMADWSSMPS